MTPDFYFSNYKTKHDWWDLSFDFHSNDEYYNTLYHKDNLSFFERGVFIALIVNYLILIRDKPKEDYKKEKDNFLKNIEDDFNNKENEIRYFLSVEDYGYIKLDENLKNTIGEYIDKYIELNKIDKLKQFYFEEIISSHNMKKIERQKSDSIIVDSVYKGAYSTYIKEDLCFDL